MSDYRSSKEKGRLISEMIQNRIKSLRSYKPSQKKSLSVYFRTGLEGAISERQEKLQVPEGFTDNEKKVFIGSMDVQIVSALYRAAISNPNCNANTTLEILDIIYEIATKQKLPTPELDMALLDAIGISSTVEVPSVVRVGIVQGIDYN